MRLWHEQLIPLLPRQQLLGQHRECCALRGNGWAKKHATVDYVFSHSPYKLFLYHKLIMAEMQARGYSPDLKWSNPLYRGKSCPAYKQLKAVKPTKPLYLEHNQDYLEECLDNLSQKGIYLSIITKKSKEKAKKS